jgi:hypothetical protein
VIVGVNKEFIIKGIHSGKLEYRDGAMWGNFYLRLLRSQLEAYIVEELGPEYLSRLKYETELGKVKKEITSHTRKLSTLQKRKTELEMAMGIVTPPIKVAPRR